MPNVDKGCVTHSFACDCREERMRKLEKVAEAAKRYSERVRRVAEGQVFFDTEQAALNAALAAMESDE